MLRWDDNPLGSGNQIIMSPYRDKALVDSSWLVSIVLVLLALVTVVIKAIVAMYRKSTEWAARKVGEALSRELK